MIEKGKPIHIRLINSDEIIGELQETTNDNIIIKKPMVVSEITDPKTNHTNVVLSKYVLFDNNEDVTLSRNHIITMTGVLKEIGEFYYNSIEFNAIHLEPKIVSNIASVNQNMRNYLNQSVEEVVVSNAGDKLAINYHPISNTIH
jgi:hypothetical protein